MLLLPRNLNGWTAENGEKPSCEGKKDEYFREGRALTYTEETGECADDERCGWRVDSQGETVTIDVEIDDSIVLFSSICPDTGYRRALVDFWDRGEWRRGKER